MELIAVLVAAVLVLAGIAAMIGLVAALVALAVKAVPLLLLGYFGVTLVRRWERSRPAITPSEAAWLDRRG